MIANPIIGRYYWITTWKATRPLMAKVTNLGEGDDDSVYVRIEDSDKDLAGPWVCKRNNVYSDQKEAAAAITNKLLKEIWEKMEAVNRLNFSYGLEIYPCFEFDDDGDSDSGRPMKTAAPVKRRRGSTSLRKRKKKRTAKASGGSTN